VLLPYTAVNAWRYLRGPHPPAAARNVELALALALALAVFAVLYLLYTDLLRRRELYADLDAISWGAPTPSSGPEPAEQPAGRLGLFSGLGTRRHPKTRTSGLDRLVRVSDPLQRRAR
jgi:hypothetical protein